MKLLCFGLAAIGFGLMAWASAAGPKPIDRSPERLAELLNLVASSNRPTPEQVDTCAGQFDAQRSKLFWYTNLDQARDEAQANGKLVLSLRLLGRLDEQYSCANSRFFRAILYPDPEINKLLREHFVLHWESVCKVPVITIDLGDGRVIKRTITGNSIHYVMRPDGTVIDALPGLIAPRVFEHELRPQIESNRDSASPTDRLRATIVRLTVAEFPDTDMALPLETQRWLAVNQPRVEPRKSDARPAGRLAMSKIALEGPLLRQVFNPFPQLSADTRINMTSLRPRILAMLEHNPAMDIKTLNARVYDEIFMMPLIDPWLGLDPPDVFTGLSAHRR